MVHMDPSDPSNRGEQGCTAAGLCGGICVCTFLLRRSCMTLSCMPGMHAQKQSTPVTQVQVQSLPTHKPCFTLLLASCGLLRLSRPHDTVIKVIVLVTRVTHHTVENLVPLHAACMEAACLSEIGVRQDCSDIPDNDISEALTEISTAGDSSRPSSSWGQGNSPVRLLIMKQHGQM